jgi:1-acyl-sn-glycerol-3-phosphate acyltransferase
VKARTLLLALLLVLMVVCLTIPLLLTMAVGFRRPWLPLGTWAVRTGARLLGVRVEIRGRENIISGRAAVYMGNHVSILDGPLVVAFLPGRVRVIIKKEAFRLPVVGMGMRFVGFIPVDRSGSEAGRAAIEKAAAAIRTTGDPFVIFPEGTRSRDGRLQRFRKGGFYLAAESGAPIVPVVVEGTRDLMPRGAWFIRPGLVRITFLPAVATEGVTPETLAGLIERVRSAIARELDKEKP